MSEQVHGYAAFGPDGEPIIGPGIGDSEDEVWNSVIVWDESDAGSSPIDITDEEWYAAAEGGELRALYARHGYTVRPVRVVVVGEAEG